MDIKLPPVTDEDISWVTNIMGLPEDAFAPEKDDGARMAILKSEGESMDIEACPGSGKTTLLVAKLAIMARHWPSRRQGICVLSHTNVAKDEIQKRLGNTDEGRALLSYPHYIGTIHGFVNKFLAMPLLFSKGTPVRSIGDDVALEWRWQKLPNHIKDAILRSPANQRNPRKVLKVIDRQLNVADINAGRNQRITKEDNITYYKCIINICKQSFKEGFICYDEMFFLAEMLMAKFPSVTRDVRYRFPIFFVDEAQDNSGFESSILQQVCTSGDEPSYRIRLGDSDQAIFDEINKNSTHDDTDRFPEFSLKRNLVNSHRFDQSIANLAGRVSVSKIDLIGTRAPEPEVLQESHAIFLIDDETISQTLDVYGRHIIETLGADQEKLDEMIFTAVGGVHKDQSDSKKIPHSVGHYFSDYDPQVNKANSNPETFLQYVSIGLKITDELAVKGSGGESFHIVEKFGKGLIDAAKKVSPDAKYPSRYYHRFILDILTDTECGSGKENNALSCYSELVEYFCIKKQYPDCQDWNEAIRNKVVCVVRALARTTVDFSDGFFAFPESQTNDLGSKSKNNIHSVAHDSKKISIRLGSIHSVKGETHTATLVLETFNNTHNLKNILGFLCDRSKKIGTAEYRLKLHYVAMTRASHILCLAMRKDALFENKKDPNKRNIQKLKEAGWKVGVVTSSGSCDWL